MIYLLQVNDQKETYYYKNRKGKPMVFSSIKNIVFAAEKIKNSAPNVIITIVKRDIR